MLKLATKVYVYATNREGRGDLFLRRDDKLYIGKNMRPTTKAQPCTRYFYV